KRCLPADVLSLRARIANAFPEYCDIAQREVQPLRSNRSNDMGSLAEEGNAALPHALSSKTNEGIGGARAHGTEGPEQPLQVGFQFAEECRLAEILQARGLAGRFHPHKA